MPVFSAPIFKGKAVDAAEVLGVVGNDRPLVAEAGVGDENVGNADGCSLVEQSGIEAGGDAGAFGIEGLDLQGGGLLLLRDLTPALVSGAFDF
jgi:hypothetical protein